MQVVDLIIFLGLFSQDFETKLDELDKKLVGHPL